MRRELDRVAEVAAHGVFQNAVAGLGFGLMAELAIGLGANAMAGFAIEFAGKFVYGGFHSFLLVYDTMIPSEA